MHNLNLLVLVFTGEVQQNWGIMHATHYWKGFVGISILLFFLKLSLFASRC